MMAEAFTTRALNSAVVRLTRNIKLNTFQSQLKEPVVSFTFDDVPRSAFTEGGRILKEMGWTGSYFVAGSFCGRRVDGIDYMDRDDVVQADHEGHEIGCHTFSHLRLRQTSAEAIA
ncbi:MAG TPA: polysaccharide deacetylase family protein, partial [Rhizomicrobium sp.]|nr:polysaccharide deacetylase family protein [Rhizomicrobium sp.]